MWALSPLRTADCLRCSDQHQLDDMLTVTMAADGWLISFTCIICAGRGWADTVWIAHIEHEHHHCKGRVK